MKRIIEISPSFGDATSYYRSRGPLSRLQKERDDIEVLPLRVDELFDIKITWADLAVGDILFLSRPASQEMVDIVKLANKMNLPVWVDYDDLLTEVPKWNRTHTYYAQPNVEVAIEQILTMAQVVTVTTPMLKRKLSAYNENVHVIPNAVDDYLFPEPIEFSNNDYIVWRGGDTHMNDLYVHRKAINAAMSQHLDCQFVFLGYDAPFLDNHGNKSVLPPDDIHSYFNTLKSLNASINLVVLDNNDFNIAKSNIGFLETAWAGGISVAPDFGPKQNIYNDKIHFLYDKTMSIEDMVNIIKGTDRYVLLKKWESSIDAIRKEYVLSVTNELRYNLIMDITAQF